MQQFTAKLIAPNGYSGEYTVWARNKTEARKKIAEAYRNDTGPVSAGFYSFGAQKLIWLDE